MPRWNTISVSGYHIREAGSTAVQEVAFTLANGIAYVQAAVDAGLDVDAFAPRISFFFNAHNDFLEEVAKFRAARKLWAQMMRERYGAKDPKSLALRFHAQTAGSTLTAQQPENNVVRVADPGDGRGARRLPVAAHELARRGAGAADRGVGEDRAAHAAGAGARERRRPTRRSARRLVRDRVADRSTSSAARELIERIDAMGGAVAAIEQGFVQHEIEESAYRIQQRRSRTASR